MRPHHHRARSFTGLALAVALGACDSSPSQPARTPSPPSVPSPPAQPEPRAEPTPAPPVAPEPSAAPAPPPDPGAANRDPSDDYVVAPPDVIADCEQRLKAAGVEFQAAKLPVKTTVQGRVCGAPQVVRYLKGPGGIAWSRPVITCQLALGLARFELLLQEHAQRTLGTKLTRALHGGGYSCRKMQRFDYVSEHSYANALDIYGFRRADGATVSVKMHFGKLDQPAQTSEARFLREVSSAAFDEDVFSVVLNPFWDNLHHDHLHVDQARYRADGTRPSGSS